MEKGREEGAVLLLLVLLLLVLLLDVLLDKVVARGDKDNAPDDTDVANGGNS